MAAEFHPLAGPLCPRRTETPRKLPSPGRPVTLVPTRRAVTPAGVVTGRWASVAVGAVVTGDTPRLRPGRRRASGARPAGSAGPVRLVADGPSRWRCPQTNEEYRETNGALAIAPDPAR